MILKECKESNDGSGCVYILESNPNYQWFIGHAWAENYCHWMMDCVSDVCYITDNGYDNTTVVLFEDQNHHHVNESLEILNVKSERIKRGQIFCKDWIMREFNIVFNPMRHTGTDTEKIVKWWNSKRPDVKKTTEVLLIRRNTQHGNACNTSRNILNESDLVDALKPLSVKTVEFEKMPVREQMESVASAKCVIGVSGAGLTNIVFGDKDTLFIELQCPQQGRHRFSNMARIVGMRHSQFVYPRFLPTDDYYSWSMVVDSNEISDFVKLNMA